MIRSMTGYGRGKYDKDGRSYTVDIKTVNHKYLDINVKLPRQISYLEDKTRRLISESFTRGKVDVFITFENFSNVGRELKLDRALAEGYIAELRSLVTDYKLKDDISACAIARIPDVLKIENEDDETLFWDELKEAVKEACKNLLTMKVIEGKKLKEDILIRLNSLSNRINKIDELSSGLVEEYIKKLEDRIKELTQNTQIDETRLAQEVVIYSDKCSIQEEVTRFKSHIEQFKETLNSDEAVGKRLDFLVQEINREINTIGSKANSLAITKQVVEVKTELENIREQIQNIE